MKQFFKKSLLEFVSLSTTIRSCRIAYFHLDTVLFIFIVLYLCFSSVSACLMQRLSFSLSEIKTYWTTLGLFSVSMSFWMSKKSTTHLATDACFLPFHTTPPSHIYIMNVMGMCACRPSLTCSWLMCQEQVEWECGEATVGAGNTRQVCTAYVVTWCL